MGDNEKLWEEAAKQLEARISNFKGENVLATQTNGVITIKSKSKLDIKAIAKHINEKSKLSIFEIEDNKDLSVLLKCGFSESQLDKIGYFTMGAACGVIGIDKKNVSKIDSILKKNNCLENVMLIEKQDYVDVVIMRGRNNAGYEKDYTQHVKMVELKSDQYTGKKIIQVNLDEKGKLAFGSLTGNNLESRIAIFLDDKMLTCPTVMGKIEGGSFQISSNMTDLEIRAAYLRLSANYAIAKYELL